MMMTRLSLLSRLFAFNAIAGLNNSYKDYLSIVKDQGEEGLCWAYSLTSTIEIKYALKSGNRLMLDPLTLYNNSVDWFNKHKKAFRDNEGYEKCLSYSDNKGYPQDCAVGFMVNSKQTMIQRDGNDSYVYVSDVGVSEIKTVQDLIDALNEHSVLYSGIDSSVFGSEEQVIDDYRTGGDITHGLVITALGYIEGLEGHNGLYVELLNSWGYVYHYDGLMYVKVADSLSDELHNNLNMFDVNIWIEVDKLDEVALYKSLVIALGVLLCVTLLIIIGFVISIIISNGRNCCKCKCNNCFKHKSTTNDELETDLNVVKV